MRLPGSRSRGLIYLNEPRSAADRLNPREVVRVGVTGGVITCVRAVLAGIIMLAALILLGSVSQASDPHRQTVQGATFVRTLQDDRDDDGSPCHDDCLLPGCGCCVAMQGSAAVAVIPRIVMTECLRSAIRAEYLAVATPRTHGIPVAPALPPPRALA